MVGISQQAITMVRQFLNLEAMKVPLKIQTTWKAPCGIPNATVRSGSPTRPLLYQEVSKDITIIHILCQLDKFEACREYSVLHARLALLRLHLSGQPIP